MDSQTDHQKMISMKEMIAQKARKNQRDKIIEKSRNSNPFTDQKKFIQQNSTQKTQIQASDFNGVQISDEVLAKIQQFEQEIPLEQEEIDHFQKLTLNSFKFRLSKLQQNNINSEESVKLLENIPDFFKENKKNSDVLIKKFKEDGALEILLNFIKNLESLNPITYQIARIIEIISIFAQVEEFINCIWIDNEIINLFLNLCTENQDQQVLEQLFQLLGFLCSDSGIERRDYLRNTPLISYLCKQIDRYQMKQTCFASLLVRNGIWLLVSLCSDLPAEGNFDYCKDALPIFVHFLKCNNGTVGQECTWVLDTLIQYYISPQNPNQQQNLDYFIQLELPINLTETFKFDCLTTTQSALKILKQVFENCKSVQQKLQVANEKVVSRVLGLLKVQQRILVYKVIFEFVQALICDPLLIQILLKCQIFTYLFNAIKNPDLKYNTIGIKCLSNIVIQAQDNQISELVEQGLFTHLKIFFDQNQEEMISSIMGLEIVEIILEAGDCIFQSQKAKENIFKIKMESSGLLQNLDSFQLSTKEAISQKAIQIIERFCLQKVEGIEEEIN
ncbi:importin subunit alpha, putative (macronuclear) [Tetrahymena thermophila SB210]|uniref:Importin subunit alpha, putative n=1 Tax=Tetrahymena thermophila (strain SB210) TaxID=312017 RepID=Q23DA7_TETTS|nr:importin subunit alpha, putative [Tetrahymena thermophila SB210]EAR94407.2 importin subunit alpha, putative [Tetrahymena thermophila SB210]|eukprot:XP_001014779.2 importin subunit alpha, putative [Tetrahymena thermophila SB210]